MQLNAKTRNANNVDLTCALHVGSDVLNARVVPGLVPFLSDIITTMLKKKKKNKEMEKRDEDCSMRGE